VTTCAASATVVGNCNFNCECTFNNMSTVPVLFTRAYACNALTQASFIWTSYTFSNSTFNLNVSVNATFGNTSAVISSASVTGNVSALAGAAATPNSVEGSFYADIDTNVTFYNFSFALNTLPCVPITQVGQNVITITPIPGNLVSYTVTPISGPAGVLNNTVYTIPPTCSSGTYNITSNFLPIAGLTCPLSSQQTLLLTEPPTIPDVVNLTINFTAVSGTNLTSLVLSPLWSPSNGFACTSITYYTSVSAGSPTGPQLLSWDLDSTKYNSTFILGPNISVVFPLVELGIKQSGWNENQEYFFNVFAGTAVGNSTASSFKFTLPNYVPPADDSSSGLSNTVIAGIAVGATVGVVALALIIYKCSAGSRGGYENIKGGESHA